MHPFQNRFRFGFLQRFLDSLKGSGWNSAIAAGTSSPNITSSKGPRHLSDPRTAHRSSAGFPRFRVFGMSGFFAVSCGVLCLCQESVCAFLVGRCCRRFACPLPLRPETSLLLCPGPDPFARRPAPQSACRGFFGFGGWGSVSVSALSCCRPAPCPRNLDCPASLSPASGSPGPFLAPPRLDLLRVVRHRTLGFFRISWGCGVLCPSAHRRACFCHPAPPVN